MDTKPTGETELTGKVAVVTGGSRGMGREMVHAFAERGAHVVIASRKLDACQEVAAEVTERYGVRALPVACNVSSWDDCGRLADTVYAEFGRVDVLVNNAGLSPLYPSLTEVSEALFDKVIGVNLRGPFRLTALIGERMAAGDGGSIISIGSIESLRPNPTALPYAAAKAGLHALTEGFARAYGPKVRVNTIQAGPFLTDISEHWPEGMREQMESALTLGRCGEPHEIVGAVLFFATSASSYATGASLCVDGGHW
jgi:NAD(P)-dependent dehydrogenase (short-subunit alcohol dehydrogenase family)